MRYFTKELYKGTAEGDWIENLKEYAAQFQRLENRFSKRVYKILSNYSFHDYEIIGLELKHQDRGRYPLEIIIKIRSGEQVWILIYKKVTKVEINIPSSYGKAHLGVWGYDEFLEVNDEETSHEIMLIPQCESIRIEFRNKNFFIEKG